MCEIVDIRHGNLLRVGIVLILHAFVLLLLIHETGSDWVSWDQELLAKCSQGPETKHGPVP